MISKSQILQQVKRLYAQNLDHDALEYELQQFTDMHAALVEVMVELFDTDDPYLKEFVVKIIGQIEDLEEFPELSRIILESNKSDKMKIFAATIMGYLGKLIDHDELKDSLNVPDELEETLTRNMLADLESPYFFEEFLKLFPDLDDDQKLMMVEILESSTGNERIVDVVGALITYCDNSALFTSLILTLRNSQSHKAYPHLKQIIQKSADRTVQALARKMIFQLGELDQNGEMLRLKPAARFHEAYVTNHDGRGEQICIFSARENRQITILFTFILDETKGIVDAIGSHPSKKDYSDYINNLLEAESLLCVSVSPEYVIQKARQAEEQNQRSQTELPIEYLAWRAVFDCEYGSEKALWESRQEQWAAFSQKAESNAGKLFPQTVELFDGPFLWSWLYGSDELGLELAELDRVVAGAEGMLSSVASAFPDIFQRAYEHAMTEQKIRLIAGRLREYAYLCFLEGNSRHARLALAASGTLPRDGHEEHPFLHQFIELSIQVLIEQIIISAEETNSDQLEMFESDAHAKRAPNDSAISSEHIMHGVHELSGEELPDAGNPEPEPALLPRNSELSDFEKLNFLNQTLPDTNFSADFQANAKTLPIKKRISLLNCWESGYDSFIQDFVGPINWDELRLELGIKIRDDLLEDLPAEAEMVFLGIMPDRDYDWEHLHIARRLWKEFVFLMDGKLSPAKLPKAWAAAIEYLVGALCFDRDPQAAIAKAYGTSASAIASRYKIITRTLNLRVFKNYYEKKLSYVADILNHRSKE